MELALITVEKILEMFVILLMGVVIRKCGMVDERSNKHLSGILLNLVSPCVILMSYQIDFDAMLLERLLWTAGLSAISFVLSIFLANFCVRKNGNPDFGVERMAVIYSNCGFMGLPLIEGLLGSEGVFFMTAYITVFNLFVWSHGVMMMSGRASSFAKTMKSLIQPSMVAIFFSLILFVVGIRLPAVVANPLSMIGKMNTPLAMLIAGANLADSDLLASLKRPRIYWLSALKLLIVPAMTLVELMILHPDRTVALTVLIAAACPAGTMGTLFAIQYHKNGHYASELFAITTVLSLLTVSAMVILAGIFL
ncbi:AEC family transporter [Brotaphodocola sp.]|uniref:AEC family transporter n=1 Tax=Brotaphodocola sp. TaxID=3073577 RepID=UPI003D7EBD61